VQAGCISAIVPTLDLSLSSPPNDVGFNRTVGPDAAPRAINPKTGKRKHVSAVMIFTKQFHQFARWGFTG
jgi:hypothetical protein